MQLIDFSQFCRAAMFASKMETSADKNLMKHVIMNSIRAINVKYRDRYGQLILCCDGGKYWRKDVFPYYKAARAQQRKDSGMNEEAFFEAKDELTQELGDHTPWNIVRVQKAEADDLIALFCYNYTNEPMLIVSSDKDFLQLQAYPHVNQLCPRTGKELKCDDPAYEIFHKVMKGDTGDGVPNVRSDGDTLVTEGKRQKPIKETLIQELYNSYQKKDLDAVASDNFPDYFCDALVDKEIEPDNFKRNYQLISLLEVNNTHPEFLDAANEQIEEQKKNYKGSSALMKYLASNKMDQLLDKLSDFSNSNPQALI